MKISIVVALLCAVGISRASAEQPKKEVRDPYSTRAGAFYEKEYLSGAVKGLEAVFAPQDLSDDKATQMLLDQIYGFLGQLHKENGEISRRGHAGIIARLDREVAALADDRAILNNYEAWKDGSSNKYPNPLSFLTNIKFQSPPLQLALNADLRQAGWVMQSLDALEETGRFADALGVEPYQVFTFSQVEAGRMTPRMDLLVCRLRDAATVLIHLDSRKDSQESEREIPELFWRTNKHAIFFVGRSDANMTAARDWIKRQWIAK